MNGNDLLEKRLKDVMHSHNELVRDSRAIIAALGYVIEAVAAKKLVDRDVSLERAQTLLSIPSSPSRQHKVMSRVIGIHAGRR